MISFGCLFNSNGLFIGYDKFAIEPLKAINDLLLIWVSVELFPFPTLNRNKVVPIVLNLFHVLLLWIFFSDTFLFEYRLQLPITKNKRRFETKINFLFITPLLKIVQNSV